MILQAVNFGIEGANQAQLVTDHRGFCVSKVVLTNLGRGPKFSAKWWSNWQSRSCVPGKFEGPIWVFPKIGVPQNGWFTMENPIKNGWFGGTPIFGNIYTPEVLRCFTCRFEGFFGSNDSFQFHFGVKRSGVPAVGFSGEYTNSRRLGMMAHWACYMAKIAKIDESAEHVFVFFGRPYFLGRAGKDVTSKNLTSKHGSMMIDQLDQLLRGMISCSRRSSPKTT